MILSQSPREAVGLILSDDRVVELTNYSDNADTHFEVHKSDILVALKDELDSSAVIFWHSHPGGGIGPSRTDMRQKIAFQYHLVLTLIDGEIVPTWY